MGQCFDGLFERERGAQQLAIKVCEVVERYKQVGKEKGVSVVAPVPLFALVLVGRMSKGWFLFTIPARDSCIDRSSGCLVWASSLVLPIIAR